MDTFNALLGKGNPADAVKSNEPKIPEVVTGTEDTNETTTETTDTSTESSTETKQEAQTDDTTETTSTDFEPGKYIRPEPEKKEDESDDSYEETEETDDSVQKSKPEDSKSEFDFSVFGDKYNSTDDVKSDLGRLSELEEEINSLKETLGKSQSPFADPEIARINSLYTKLKEQGISFDVAQRLSAINEDRLKSMSDLDVLVLQEVVNSNSPLDEAMLRKVLSRGYKISTPSEEALEDMTDEEKRSIMEDIDVEKYRLKKDADQARVKLSEMTEVDVPVAKSAEELVQAQKQSQTKLKEEWSPVVPELLEKGLKEIPIPNGDWKNEYMKFEVKPEDRKSLNSRVIDYVVNNNIPLTEENVKAVHSAVVNQYVLDNLPHMFSVVISKAKREATDEKEKEIHNPSSLNKENRVADKSKRKDDQQMNLDRIL